MPEITVVLPNGNKEFCDYIEPTQESETEICLIVEDYAVIETYELSEISTIRKYDPQKDLPGGKR